MNITRERKHKEKKSTKNLKFVGFQRIFSNLSIIQGDNPVTCPNFGHVHLHWYSSKRNCLDVQKSIFGSKLAKTSQNLKSFFYFLFFTVNINVNSAVHVPEFNIPCVLLSLCKVSETILLVFVHCWDVEVKSWVTTKCSCVQHPLFAIERRFKNNRRLKTIKSLGLRPLLSCVSSCLQIFFLSDMINYRDISKTLKIVK